MNQKSAKTNKLTKKCTTTYNVGKPFDVDKLLQRVDLRILCKLSWRLKIHFFNPLLIFLYTYGYLRIVHCSMWVFLQSACGFCIFEYLIEVIFRLYCNRCTLLCFRMCRVMKMKLFNKLFKLQ